MILFRIARKYEVVNMLGDSACITSSGYSISDREYMRTLMELVADSYIDFGGEQRA